MPALADLELPQFDFMDTTLRGERFHATMAELASQGWLAKAELGYFVLDRESASFFLRTQAARPSPARRSPRCSASRTARCYEEMRRNILHVNGDDHRRLRNLVNPAFTPRAADRWRPAMRGFLEQLWDDVAGRAAAASSWTTSPSRTRR